jgi:hypothetical protein
MRAKRIGAALLLVSAAAVLACGAKTGILLPGAGGGGGGTSSGGGGAGTPGTPGPLAVHCTSAQQANAPTPTVGYCPTRANQAPFVGPQSPHVAWTASPFAIDNPENFLPAEIVVDASGQIDVLVDASPLSPTGTSLLVALDALGGTVWTTPLDGPGSGLSLGADGTLWEVEETPSCLAPLGYDCTSDAGVDVGPPVYGCVIVGFSPSGAEIGAASVQVPVPPSGGGETPVGLAALALASDGTFFVDGAFGEANFTMDLLARVTRTSVLVSQAPGLGGSPLVVTPFDEVTAAGTGVASDPTGALWTTDVLTEVAGSPTYDTSRLAVAGDGTVVVLYANEASAPGLTKTHVTLAAVDPSTFRARWTTAFDASLPYDPAVLGAHYGVFIDAGGTVVVTAGTITGFDLQSGVQRWSLVAPHPDACLRPAVLGPGGSIVATQCDGTVFLARD